jgi:hypothetical protein
VRSVGCVRSLIGTLTLLGPIDIRNFQGPFRSSWLFKRTIDLETGTQYFSRLTGPINSWWSWRASTTPSLVYAKDYTCLQEAFQQNLGIVPVSGMLIYRIPTSMVPSQEVWANFLVKMRSWTCPTTISLTGAIPLEFENLMQLGTLQLPTNMLSGPVPESVGHYLHP